MKIFPHEERNIVIGKIIYANVNHPMRKREVTQTYST